MKKKLYVLALLFLLSSQIAAQITITSDDINSYYTIGTTYVNNYDTATTHMYIGEKGSFTMTFTGHVFAISSAATSVTAASSGYADRFPGAQFAVKSTQATSDGTLDIWSFYSIQPTEFLIYGQATKISIGGFDMETIVKSTPVNSAFKIPMNYNDMWVSDYTDTSRTYFGGMQTMMSAMHSTSTHTVDGYGTITTPDNRNIDVLRIKMDTRTFSSLGGYSRMINYSFISKTGETFSMTAADTTEAETGIIAVMGLLWQTRTATSVNDNNTAINEFHLYNNYPNPFNPSTKITYNVPEASRINIQIINMLGETVRVINETAETPGIHEINFNASGLSSGTYIYTLNAKSFNGKNSFTSSGKMMLIK